MYLFFNCSFEVQEMRQPGISLGNVVGCENLEYEFELSFDVISTEVKGVALDLHIYENGAWHRALWLRFYHTYKISPNCTCFYKINPDGEISACKQQ